MSLWDKLDDKGTTIIKVKEKMDGSNYLSNHSMTPISENDAKFVHLLKCKMIFFTLRMATIYIKRQNFTFLSSIVYQGGVVRDPEGGASGVGGCNI